MKPSSLLLLALAVFSTGCSGCDGGSGDPGGDAATDAAGAVALAPVECAAAFVDPADYATGGLPLLQSNPEAGLVLFVDFDGGSYHGVEDLSAYYTGTSDQRVRIVESFNYLTQYFAMFDLSITTDASAIGAASPAEAWGWIVVTPDISGGSGYYDGIGSLAFAQAKVGTSTLTSSDHSRRIAHELGHNFSLAHDGLYEVPGAQDLAAGENLDGDPCVVTEPLCFFKFEDSTGWDQVYGTIMGGGGKGMRNGWGLELYEPSSGGTSDVANRQDSMAQIRSVVRALGGPTENDGWAIDDHADSAPSPLCIDASQRLYRVGVLGSPDDVDVFSLDWPGGDLHVTGGALGASAALIEVAIYRAGVKVGDDAVVGAAPGAYEIHVRSTGAYGALGYYRVDVD